MQLKQRLMTTGWDLSWLCYRPKRGLPLQVDVDGGQVAGLAAHVEDGTACVGFSCLLKEEVRVATRAWE